MSLETRITALAQAIAADVKSLIASVTGKAGKGVNADITELQTLTAGLKMNAFTRIYPESNGIKIQLGSGTAATGYITIKSTGEIVLESAGLSSGGPLIPKTVTVPLGSTAFPWLQAFIKTLTMSGAINQATPVTIASAATVAVYAAASNVISVTGTTTITSLGAGTAGAERTLVFASALSLTASASLVLPGLATGASYSVVAGDSLEFTCFADNVWTLTRGAASKSFEDMSFIRGLFATWNSGSSITVSSGGAYIPALGRTLPVPAAITASGLSLPANAFSHVYLYSNAGVPALEFSSTEPAAPYTGTARTKTGDTSRRYVVSLRTDGAGAIYSFLQKELDIYYRFTWGLVSRILNGGTATAVTQVDFAPWIPSTARIGRFKLLNTAPNAGAAWGIDTSAVDTPGSTDFFRLTSVEPSSAAYTDLPLSYERTIKYGYTAVAPSSGGAIADVGGYTYAR